MKKLFAVLLCMAMVLSMGTAFAEADRVVITYSYWGTPDEAAVAHFEVTGKRNLLDVALKLADHIVGRFMDDDAIPGHQEIEIALMRLYHATGEAKYLDMARRFADHRR